MSAERSDKRGIEEAIFFFFFFFFFFCFSSVFPSISPNSENR